MNATRTQSSVLVNVNDPIQMHLLVETALSDSQEFEILSPEEVDELKRQCRTLTSRIEQTRHSLTIQSKYRDAAISMSKLYSGPDKARSPDGTEKKHRLSLLGSRGSNSDRVREADLERLTSERRCEELANELWILEKRLMDPQKRLLQHTAGILQMTHKGPMKVPRTNVNGVIQQGIPGSPESIYTYTNGRSSMEPVNGEDLFDERSLYRTFDRIDGAENQRDSWDLGGRGSPRSPERSREKEIVAEHKKTITETEQKLKDLNGRLRAIIVKSNPQLENSLSNPPQSSPSEVLAPSTLVFSHLNYLERSISAVDEEQRRLKDAKRDSDIQIEEAINDVNCAVQSLLLPYNANIPSPPEVTGGNIEVQLQYLQSTTRYIESELQYATSANEKKVSELQENAAKLEAVLKSTWDTIEAGELQQRQNQSKGAVGDDENDVTRDGLLSPSEIFSVQAFSTRIQQLYTKAINLNDQKKVLQRQIKQQRELHTTADEAKDTRVMQLEDELDLARKELQAAEKESQDLQAQLEVTVTHLDETRRENTQYSLEKSRKEGSESVALKELSAKLQESNNKIIKLEEELQDLKDDYGISSAEMQSRLATSASKIESLSSDLAKAEEEAAMLGKQIDDKEAEIEHANMEIARLQTEVTLARAELDGAYGTRAQRAAEAASNPAIQKEIDSLTKRNKALQAEIDSLKAIGGEQTVAELKRELSETIEEYEEMTKASIEWEKEREALEREIDKLRDEKEGLEAKLSDEQVRWLGVKNPGPDSPNIGAGTTSTMVLKNEFKKMMRDTRAENAKALRVSSYRLVRGLLLCAETNFSQVEQAERRRLEDELRLLKKAQGPGKSGLSQSVVSPS
jgi:Up-regulated During Septation